MSRLLDLNIRSICTIEKWFISSLTTTRHASKVQGKHYNDVFKALSFFGEELWSLGYSYISLPSYLVHIVDNRSHGMEPCMRITLCTFLSKLKGIMIWLSRKWLISLDSIIFTCQSSIEYTINPIEFYK